MPAPAHGERGPAGIGHSCAAGPGPGPQCHSLSQCPARTGGGLGPQSPRLSFPSGDLSPTAGSPQLTWQTRQMVTVLDVVQEPTEGERGVAGRAGHCRGARIPPCQVPMAPAHQSSVLLTAFAGLYGEALPPRCWAADSRRAVLGTPQRSRTVSPGGRGPGTWPLHPMMMWLPVLCSLAGAAARGHRGSHRHQPDGRYVVLGHLRCSGEHPGAPACSLSPGSPEGCWELLTLQWDLLVATCSAPHRPPSLVSRALAPHGTA